MKAAGPLSVTTSLTILKPIEDVFAAVLLPRPFFVARASGPMEHGKPVTWVFPEFDQEIPVTVLRVREESSVRMKWGSAVGGQNTVDFHVAVLNAAGQEAAKKQGLDPARATTLTITESGWPDTDKGRDASYQNLMGWTHMACALKAYLEHGVNLRTGAFLHFKF